MNNERSLSRRSLSREPPRKPLYLNPPTPVRVDAQGDSLVVLRDACAQQRYPIERISRIVATATVNWTGRALTLCLRTGVPVVWADGSGDALGNIQPRKLQTGSFAIELETYLSFADWRTRFDNWLLCRRRDTLSASFRRLVPSDQPFDRRRFEKLKHSYVHNGEHPQEFHPQGETWCHAWVVEALHKEGIRSSYVGNNAQVLDLASHLTDLLWAELNFDCGSFPSGTTDQHFAVRMFEAWIHQRETRVLRHLADLKRHVASEIDLWS